MIFGYGDSVRISPAAPQRFRPGAIGEVVSLYEVKETDSEDQLGVQIGTVLIGIEMSDGSYVDVPVEYVCSFDGDDRTNAKAR
ncbi:MAG: hypothetical protein A3E78_04075 [Alphaproteobacteria bacterium RIFCSPHIGHO2_12_FULL_63_12]|nr:MAG: hypothetical protein A3E78_04075 [Alphaproteobacteria bacterium RIFCSPHIGHO2_12_FULL_63_12]